MPFLITAVALVGLLCLLDLLLTMAVIRRLREHTNQLAALRAAGPPPGLLPVGSPLPALTVHSIDGEQISSEETPPQLLAFLSTTCDVCTTQLPDLVQFLQAGRIARSAAIVVIIGPDSAEGQHLVNELGPVVTVIREPMDGPIGKAFSVNVFPTFYLVSDGVVGANAISVARLPQPVAA